MNQAPQADLGKRWRKWRTRTTAGLRVLNGPTRSIAGALHHLLQFAPKHSTTIVPITFDQLVGPNSEGVALRFRIALFQPHADKMIRRVEAIRGNWRRHTASRSLAWQTEIARPRFSPMKLFSSGPLFRQVLDCGHKCEYSTVLLFTACRLCVSIPRPLERLLHLGTLDVGNSHRFENSESPS